MTDEPPTGPRRTEFRLVRGGRSERGPGEGQDACPACGAPEPDKLAVAHDGGDVTVCPHPWHNPAGLERLLHDVAGAPPAGSAIGSPDQPLAITVHPEHAALLGPVPPVGYVLVEDVTGCGYDMEVPLVHREVYVDGHDLAEVVPDADAAADDAVRRQADDGGGYSTGRYLVCALVPVKVIEPDREGGS